MPDRVLVEEALAVPQYLLHEMQRAGFLPRKIDLLQRGIRSGFRVPSTYHRLIKVSIEIVLRSEAPQQLLHLVVVALAPCRLDIRIGFHERYAVLVIWIN